MTWLKNSSLFQWQYFSSTKNKLAVLICFFLCSSRSFARQILLYVPEVAVIYKNQFKFFLKLSIIKVGIYYTTFFEVICNIFFRWWNHFFKKLVNYTSNYNLYFIFQEVLFFPAMKPDDPNKKKEEGTQPDGTTPS